MPFTWVYRQNNQVIASVSLIFFKPDLCEVRALAVHPQYQKQKIGKKLIGEVLHFLKNEYPVKPIRVFALTYVPEFFQKFGFQITKKENFPDKIYEVCQFCLKKEDCREIALELIIS